MNYTLAQEFYFDAAHSLNRSVEIEPSRRIHGHSYHVEVMLTGTPDPSTGMIMDLAVLRAAIDAARTELDHRMLNDIAELGPPTIENLATYLLAFLSKRVSSVSGVTVARRASGDRCTLTHQPDV
ncbi:MAG: 6-carboxytetrahydropterin synthase [Proteobacteria bacterium]|nr:6-carboxytetrahydropterin synthase [Pseudomonadota bacterium]